MKYNNRSKDIVEGYTKVNGVWKITNTGERWKFHEEMKKEGKELQEYYTKTIKKIKS